MRMLSRPTQVCLSSCCSSYSNH